MEFINNNVYLMKSNFSFGHALVQEGITHFYQIGEISIILYELPEKSFKRKAESSLVGRSFKPYDQRLYDRYVLKPHVCYVGPAGVKYIILCERIVWNGYRAT
ncbi:hypothetical protein CEXT_787241 [Caerostris extrusa]|uniref:Uncharacterized protein n=1 Tax=Caerostris extrusa TaxID=172846 RepID=A0AAV4THK2_CAEEX|nr:hypothetical protein CEXT_787241 [Caerostris extrusa]